MIAINGAGASGGTALGRLVFYKRREHGAVLRRTANAAEELVRFAQARTAAAQQLRELFDQALSETGGPAAEIFGIHRMLVEDDEYGDAVCSMITAEQVCAEYAVLEAGKRIAGVFEGMADDYLRERAADIRDISVRLLDILCGVTGHVMTLDEPAVIAADDLVPSETMQLDKHKILAFVTRSGSVHSHTAILARMMGIPAVTGTGDALLEDYAGRQIAVDGNAGRIYIEPDGETLRMLGERQACERRDKERLAELREHRSVTLDGLEVPVRANIGTPEDMEAVLACGADGVGLFRSEFVYLGREAYPTEEEQLAAYRAVVQAADGKRVVIRTLDAGADKQAAYFHMPTEQNPALGQRGIRFCLARPELFETQLRAIYRASAFGNVAILLPMISSVREVREAKRIAAKVREGLRERGADFCGNVPLGVMIETPAAAVISDVLAQEADFFSIGTNDLTQYTLAADRQNPALTTCYDARHPAVLRLMRLAVENAHKQGIHVCVCGELAVDTEMTETLLALGADELSVSPPRVLELRRRVCGIDVGAVRERCLAAL